MLVLCECLFVRLAFVVLDYLLDTLLVPPAPDYCDIEQDLSATGKKRRVLVTPLVAFRIRYRQNLNGATVRRNAKETNVGFRHEDDRVIVSPGPTMGNLHDIGQDPRIAAVERHAPQLAVREKGNVSPVWRKERSSRPGRARKWPRVEPIQLPYVENVLAVFLSGENEARPIRSDRENPFVVTIGCGQSLGGCDGNDRAQWLG